MTDVSCSHQCTWPDCTQSEELREGIKRHEEMAGMATAEIAVLTDALAEQRLQYVALFGQFESATAELARLRAQVPVGWIGPSGFTHNTATNRMWMRESPKLAAKLSPVYAAPPAQPAEPVQRLSDAGIEALAGKHGTTYRNRHFPTQPAFSFSNGSLHRFVRDIESAIQPQPGWRDIESAPKDELILVGPTKRMGVCVAMHHSRDGWVTETCSEWMTIYTPTRWMPLPPAPKATP